MPTYEYRCTRCNEQFEVYQSFQEEPLKRHRGCGGRLNKVFGSVGIVLKGSGFYRTDNRSERRSRATEREAAPDAGGSSGNGSSGDGTGTTTSSGSSSASSKAARTAKPASSSD